MLHTGEAEVHQVQMQFCWGCGRVIQSKDHQISNALHSKWLYYAVPEDVIVLLGC